MSDNGTTAYTDKTAALTPQVLAYIHEQAAPPDPAQRALIAETLALGGISEMQIPHVQGEFLTLLTQVAQATSVVEIGTFTGYSTLAIARGLPAGGRVITCDISDQYLPIAERAWTAAGVRDRIEPRIGPAATLIRELPADLAIDLAFIDADKVSYHEYWDLLLPRMRPGGLVLADNVLYSGEAADPAAQGNGLAIREFNAKVRADDRVDSVLLPLADGLTIARVRPPG